MRRKTHDEFVNELETKYPNQYEVVGKYENAKSKIKIKHRQCGNIWEITPSNILHGYSCPICNGGSIRTKESFVKIIDKLYPNQYNIIGDYKTARTKILVEHIECGYRYEVTPDNLKRGKGCPHCNLLKANRIYEIEEFLIGMRIPFMIDRTFSDLYGDYRHLKFDICIYSNDLTDFLLIEYNGEQHYDKNNRFYNEKIIEYQEKKIEYCKSKGYDLRIYNNSNSSNSDIKETILKWYKDKI